MAWDMSWVEEAKKLRSQGMNYTEIGKIVGRPSGSVRVQLNPEIKKAVKEYCSKRYQENHTKIRKQHDEYNKSHRKENRIRSMEWRKANPERFRAMIAAWNEKNPGKANESSARWAKENPEIVRANASKWRAKNREMLRLKSAEYRANNPEKERARVAKYKEENPDKVKEAARARQVANPEKFKEKNSAYRIANIDKVRAREAAYREANADKIKEQRAIIHAEHPEKAVVKNAKRRALKMNADINDLTSDQWRSILESYDGHCCYCGRTDRPLEQDHIHPLRRGGNHTASNVAPACDKCNPSKGSKMLNEWIATGGYPLHPPYKQIEEAGDFLSIS
jgi:5-methylcytosine-specific restriction endonuclease McrA